MISRARPLLGTIVSIRAQGEEPAVLRAFDAVKSVHDLMNAHSEHGDLARINGEGHRRAVPVHPWTMRVLRCAAAVSKATRGAFDVTLGRGGASHNDIVLLPGSRVRLKRRARLDLGGIAKGFAVDVAVATLRRHGARSGSVNAGGDLRVFGDERREIRVRMPGACTLAAPLFTLRDASCATSGSYFGSLQVDARRSRALCSDYSVTVCTPACMLADALTKAVAALGPQTTLLRPFRAQAYLVDHAGVVYAPCG